MKNLIYLDYAAHTPPAPEILTQILKTEAAHRANPLSKHPAGEAARQAWEETTAKILRLMQANGVAETLFTSGATEGNKLAINAAKSAHRHIITTPLDHPSVTGPISELQQQGWEVELAEILPNGQIDIEYLQSILRQDTALVCLPWIDSELGTIQPIKQIAEILTEHKNCRLHVDAAQAVGKIPTPFYDGIDTLSFSPHKFHGLAGCGVLLKRQNIPIKINGTPALSLFVSSCLALEKALQNMDENYNIVEEMRNSIIKTLSNFSKVVLNSQNPASPYILNLGVKGVKAADFTKALADRGVCVSVKSACSVPNTPSRAVLAINRGTKDAKALALSSWRVSLSPLVKKTEIEAFLQVFKDCYEELT